MSTFIALVTPIVILALINLVIYNFDRSSIEAKVGTVATVTLAFVAFLPTVNDKIPETNLIKLIEIIVYLQIGASILTLAGAWEAYYSDALTYVFDYKTNAYFMLTMLVNIICFFIFALLLLLHKFWWERIYLRQTEKKKEAVIDHQLWANKECDTIFKQLSNVARASHVAIVVHHKKIAPKVPANDKIKTGEADEYYD
jgi:hypothetical protein